MSCGIRKVVLWWMSWVEKGSMTRRICSPMRHCPIRLVIVYHDVFLFYICIIIAHAHVVALVIWLSQMLFIFAHHLVKDCTMSVEVEHDA